MEQQVGRPLSAFETQAYESLERTTYSVARSAADKEAIYRLRYRAYLKEGAIEANETGLLTDDYDLQPNVCTVGVKYDGKLVSSMRINIASRNERRTSAAKTFPDLLDPLLDDGKTMVDPNRFVVDPEFWDAIPALAHLTARLGMLAGLHFGTNYCLSTPRAEHYAFYRRFFNLKTMSTPRMYPGLVKPIGLMIIDMPSALAYAKARYPFMQPQPGEGERVFEGCNLLPADTVR